MWRLTMYDSWIIAEDGAYIGALSGGVQSWRDITMQADEQITPEPNVLVVEVEVDDQQLNALVDDDIITQEEL